MLFLKNRLKKKKDFDRVFKEGKTFKSESFFFITRENSLEETRAGFVVSKKISKKAVQRNRIKRIFREALRGKILTVKKGWDIVIVCKKEAMGKGIEEIKKEIEGILLKAGIKSTK